MFLLPENRIAEFEYKNKDVTKQVVIFLYLLLSQVYFVRVRFTVYIYAYLWVIA